jgi:hypothetical protein
MMLRVVRAGHDREKLKDDPTGHGVPPALIFCIY